MPIIVTAVLVGSLTSIASEELTGQAPAPPARSTTAPSEAKKAFETLKTLVGSWKGTVMDVPIEVTIRLASSGTAILHEATTSGDGPPQHEITMFYVEQDRLIATHYCDAGNRVRWDGTASSNGNALEFKFLDVVGSTRGGLLRNLVLEPAGSDKHLMEADFVRPDQQSIRLRGEFQRK